MSASGTPLSDGLQTLVANPQAVASTAAASDAADLPDELERLRELIVGDERRDLGAVRARIAALEDAQAALPQRLPGALEALDAPADSKRVANALADPVAQALGAAVQRNRQSLVDTLFPIIGPLIRKAIAEALRNLVADLNAGIESSLTVRGLKWRIEAWRAGVPYAQIVLKHRLAYRVEHVFLVACDSGLVLLHQSAPDLPPLDADAIAGMLTALGDFVGDSVGQGSGTLESVRVGEHLVWVVPGPRANLACFMRGVPPPQLRVLLEQRLEEIHAQAGAQGDLGESLADASGTWASQLQPAALICAPDGEGGSAATSAAPRWPLLIGLLLLLGALGWYGVTRMAWNTRIGALRAQLGAHPGFVLTGLDARPWRRLSVHGLLDADSQPLDRVLAEAHLGKAQVELDVTGYMSSDDAIVARRAARLLAPPASVQLAVRGGVLHLAGHAPAAWIESVTQHAAWIAGVARVDARVAVDADPKALARAQLDKTLRALGALNVAFVAATEPAANASAVLEAMLRGIREARELAARAGVVVSLAAVGSNDASGSAEANARLRATRAQWLVQALTQRGVAGIEVGATAVGVDGAERRGAHLQATIVEPIP